MVDVASNSGERIEERDDLGTGDAARWSYWSTQEEIALKEHRKWSNRGRKIIKRYRDERTEAMTGASGFTRLNILWSNVQTLLPVLYARTPKPDVERRFKDQDDTGRLAAMLIERTLLIQIDSFRFDAMMKAAVQDRLLPGRGVARVLYVPHYGDVIAPSDATQDEELSEPGDGVDQAPAENEEPAEEESPLHEVVHEEVHAEYVFWEDYLEGAARKWEEVPWIRYKSYLTRRELVKRFGKKKGKQVNLDYSPRGGTRAESGKLDVPEDIYKKAIIHETWDKETGEVIWWAPGTSDVILDSVDDPLDLPEFFPSCDPLLATTTNDTRTPVPDYTEYQDQANELDTLTARIDRLTRALKVSGVYPGAEKQVLQQLIDEGTENRLIPVEDWASFTDKGGLVSMIQWMPIKEIAQTLIQLYAARDKTMQLLYEITGLSDILRGSTNPDETKGAQELKAGFSQRRIAPQQKDVARFARDMIRLMASVVCSQFAAKTISRITGYPQLQPVPQLPSAPPQFQPMAVMVQPGQPAPQPQMNPAFAAWQQAQQQVQAIVAANTQKQQQFDAAIKVLQEDWPHGFRLDIEADSTIAADEQQEKQNRTEFVSSFIPLMEQVVPIAQGNPSMAALAKEIVLFGVRGFKVARPLEEAIEKAFYDLAKMQPQPPKGAAKAGAGGNSNVDSPADLALRAKESDQDAKESDQKTMIANQANAIKAQQVQGQLTIDAQRMQNEAAHDRAQIMLDAIKEENAANFRKTRAVGIEGRAAGGLT